MEIVRYRLIGPQSHAVLADILEAATECDVRCFGPNLREKKGLSEMCLFGTVNFIVSGKEQIPPVLPLVA